MKIGLAKFEFGIPVVTAGVSHVMEQHEDFGDFCRTCLARHIRGDWGDLSEEDKHENEVSLKEGFRLLSVYESRPYRRIWVVTEADRSVTTILFPIVGKLGKGD